MPSKRSQASNVGLALYRRLLGLDGLPGDESAPTRDLKGTSR